MTRIFCLHSSSEGPRHFPISSNGWKGFRLTSWEALSSGSSVADFGAKGRCAY